MDDHEKAPTESVQPVNSAPTGNEGAAPTNAPAGNARPKNVASLLMGVNVTPAWYAANRRANRFYVANLTTVMADINLAATKSSSYFKDATEIIATTGWKEQLSFDYKSSHTQIFPKSPQSGQTPQAAKLFGIAATIIVAMEVAAKELRPGYNVYDHLRILPAHFFVDHFNMARLEALAAHHSKMSTKERIDKFGPASVDHSFEKICLDAIEQFDGRLLPQLAQGYCVDKYTAKKMANFVQEKFPADLHVGPVRSSGENAAIWELGSKNAAPDFRPPRTIAPAELPPCF